MNTNKFLKPILTSFMLLLFVTTTHAERRIGNVAHKVSQLRQTEATFQNINAFRISQLPENGKIKSAVSRSTMLDLDMAGVNQILVNKPEFIRVAIPIASGTPKNLLLFRVDISSNGFRLETSEGNVYNKLNPIIHYRGIIDGDNYSVVRMSFSKEETMGLICNDEGNFVIGKIDDPNVDGYMFYNDKDLMKQLNYTCGTNTDASEEELQQYPPVTNNPGTQSVKCVNWYYEIDYDIFVGKGSLANVNAYIQGAFNQVATLYDNDGISITLQTVYVWTATDPYTGPTTSDYLNQFGAYRTSFAGDLANLVGYSGGGGIAYINGLCSSNSSYKMGYMGISSSYNTVPTYSWTVEVITHEDGHLLGSRHTHDCVWNGNNTRIDNCGPQAGYNSGSCAAGPMPSNGTIMSYCHLVGGVGINFNNGFGPQPAALILGKVNNGSCLSACSSCPPPSQPGTVSGVTNYCGSTSQTFSVAVVSGVTDYIWTLPSGWSGTSTTNSITVNTSGSGGTITVVAVNSCGNSTARTLTVTGNTAPSQPGNLSGSTSVCQSSSQTYSVTAVSGATSYNWTLPSGWSGTSTTNTIIVTTGSNSGTVSVTASNSCGNSAARSISVAISSTPAQPLAISGEPLVCSNLSYVYSVPVVSGATSYIWTLPSGWSGTSTTNSITVISGQADGDITVASSNGCGTSAARALATTIATPPDNPYGIKAIGGFVKVCPGDVMTYFVQPVGNATSYTWVAPTGAAVTGGQGTNSATITFNSGFVANDTVKVSANNGCASSIVRHRKVFRNTPYKPSNITGEIRNVCDISGTPYSIINKPGMDYVWSFSQPGASIISGQGTNAITVDYVTALTSGMLSVTANNGCGVSLARTLNVKGITFQPDPISGSSAPCENEQGVPYSINPVAGAIDYTWEVPFGSRIDDGTITSTTYTLTTTASSVTVNFSSNPGKVKVKANNLCGESPNRTMDINFSCRIANSASTSSLELDVYPNPAHSDINIKFYSESTSENRVTLSDLSGKTILTKTGISELGENYLHLNVSNLSPGIYFLVVLNGNERTINKVTVQ